MHRNPREVPRLTGLGLQNRELPGDRAPGNSQHNETEGCTVCIPKLKVSGQRPTCLRSYSLKLKRDSWCAVVLKSV